MKYSVCVDALYRNKGSFSDAVQEIKKAGYGAVEFWGWWDKDIDEIKKLKDELNLEIAAFCTMFVNPGDKECQDEYLEELKKSIDVAKKLNCSTIISQAGADVQSAQKRITRKQHRKTLIETMKKAAEIVECEGITIVIEPLNILVDHPGYHLWFSEDGFDLIDKIGSPNIKLLFDIYHQQITEGNLISNITENINKIGHFHAAGVPGRNEITRGEIDYKHVFEAINALGYKKFMGLEYMTDEDPLKGLQEAKENILI